MFKSAEEREAARREREAEEAREQASRAELVGVYLFRNTRLS